MAYPIVDASAFADAAAELKTAVGTVGFSNSTGPFGTTEGVAFIQSGVLAANLGMATKTGVVRALGFWAVKPTSAPGSGLFIGLGTQSGITPVGVQWGVVLDASGTVTFRSSDLPIGSSLSYTPNVWQYYHMTFGNGDSNVDSLSIYDTSFMQVGSTSGEAINPPPGSSGPVEFGMNTAVQSSGSFTGQCARMTQFSDAAVSPYPYEIVPLQATSTVSNTLTLVGGATLDAVIDDNNNATTAGGTGTTASQGTCGMTNIQAPYPAQTTLVGICQAARVTSISATTAEASVRFDSEGLLSIPVTVATSPVYARLASNVTAFANVDAGNTVYRYVTGAVGSTTAITDTIIYAVLILAFDAATSVGVAETTESLAFSERSTTVLPTETTDILAHTEQATTFTVTETPEVLAMTEQATSVGVTETVQVDPGGATVIKKFLIIDD